MKVRKAVIPAAGLGTRMLPATKTVPKEMLPMVDKPVIQYIIEEMCIRDRLKGALLFLAVGLEVLQRYFSAKQKEIPAANKDNKAAAKA